MNAPLPPERLRQHLIDPEICIRCNTCEETCPVGAVTHDDRNYVVDPSICHACMACIPPCPTGAIDNWRVVTKGAAYPTEAQLGWDALPAQQALAPEGTESAAVPANPQAAAATAPDTAAGGVPVAPEGAVSVAARSGMPVAAGGPVPGASTGPMMSTRAQETPAARAVSDRSPGATLPPRSASHPYVNLYTARAPMTATVTGNFRVTDSATQSDTHHIVLDFGATPFPVLEGQSIGILPPGIDAMGRVHFARQYSIASPRDGERPGYNNVALTVKRVTADYDGHPVHGVCSNYLCDLAKGDTVQVTGPFGNSFLMPNHAGSHLLMICTGTGSAPMRAMTERRRRLRAAGEEGGRLMLFFGARSERELPYFGPLMNLPAGFIDINLAYSRRPGAPRRYVQDLMHERSRDVAELIGDVDTCIYVCGLKGMEAGVLDALKTIAEAHGFDWPALWRTLKDQGRLHFETY